MNTNNILDKSYYIFGSSGISLEIAELLIKNNRNVRGFVLDAQYMDSQDEILQNIPIISYERFCAEYHDIPGLVVVSLGEPDNREKISLRLHNDSILECGVNFSDYTSSSASIGQGTIIHFGSFISNNTKIGASCLINKMSIVGHNSTIDDFCVISPRVTIGGYVSIGHNSFIGLGASIRDRVRIGNNCIVGMGAVVTKNVDDNSVVVGNPATFIRYNDSESVFKHN